MKHLGDESSSIEAATIENGGDVEEHGVFADELETTKLILQRQFCVKNVGASLSFLIQMDWIGLDLLSSPSGQEMIAKRPSF